MQYRYDSIQHTVQVVVVGGGASTIRNNARCFCFVMYARTYVVVTQIFGDFSGRINYENYIYSLFFTRSARPTIKVKVNAPQQEQAILQEYSARTHQEVKECASNNKEKNKAEYACVARLLS